MARKQEGAFEELESVSKSNIFDARRVRMTQCHFGETHIIREHS